MTIARLVPTSRLKYLTKISSVTIDDLTFKLHYRFTFSFFIIGSLLLTGEQFFGKAIQCVSSSAHQVPIKVVEAYCWIEGTFTLPNSLMKIIGYEVAAPGIEQYKEFVDEAKHQKDEVIEHSYYQWVGIVLFLQALTFYIGHVLWKGWEKDKMNNIINDLNKAILSATKKTEGKSNLVQYLFRTMGKNFKYANHYFICETINLINVIIQMLFIDWLLNNEFSSYGLDVVKFLDSDPSTRIDPMAKIFPKMTKCTFRRFGPSGDVMTSDHLCMLPLNILNEKMFVVFWFWLYIVLIFSLVGIIYRVLVILSRRFRYFLLAKIHRKAEAKHIQILVDSGTYSDWFVIHLLSKNIDPMHYRDVLKDLADLVQKSRSNDYEKQIDESLV